MNAYEHRLIYRLMAQLFTQHETFCHPLHSVTIGDKSVDITDTVSFIYKVPLQKFPHCTRIICSTIIMMRSPLILLNLKSRKRNSNWALTASCPFMPSLQVS